MEGGYVSLEKNSKIIGERVFHKSLGHGIIAECNVKYIIVHFNSDEDGKMHTFPFPDILIDPRKLMTTDSQVLSDFIKSEEVSRLCSRCGYHLNNIMLFSGKGLCPKCIGQMVICQSCGGLFERDVCQTDCYGKIQCKSCHEETHFLCSICGNERPDDELIASPFINEEKPTCEYCAENEFFACSVCGSWMPEELVIEAEYKCFCPNCIKENTFTCKICGKKAVKRDTNIEDSCYECETMHLYLDYISSLNLCKMPSYSISFYTFKQARTRKIMSRLRHSYGDSPTDQSKAPFDVLLLDTYMGKLVVVWEIPDRFGDLSIYGCTLTTLKKDGVGHLTHGTTCKVKKVVTLPNKEVFHIWERPYLLRAQTVSDMDYGDRWEGDIVYEGNKYGDTSKFYIIGYLKG